MQTINSDRVAFFDCDDTLILWNRVSMDLPEVTINNRKYQVHTKHVQKIKDYHTMGHVVIVWSNSGHEWARKVVEALGLTGCVNFAMCKPHRVFDDSKDLSDTIKHGYIPL